MATPVTMPMLSLTMEEGTVAAWLKQEGEAVQKDEPLLTVEVDKGTLEVPAPASGVLRRIIAQPGTTLRVKEVIAEIDDLAGLETPAPTGGPGGAASVPTVVGAPPQPAAAAPTTSGDIRPPAPRRAGAAHGAVAAAPAPWRAGADNQPASPDERLFASPRARMRARALGVDLRRVHGTGPRGRVVEQDVLALAAAAPAELRVSATPLARRLALEHGVVLDEVAGTGPGGRITHEDVLAAAERRLASARPAAAAAATPAAQAQTPAGVEPLSRVRRITAERMSASARSVARVTLFAEADFTELARFRQQLQPEFARLGVPKLPWDALLARALGLALVDFPAVNAEWVEGQGIRRHEAVHVGIAVALDPEGLVVPVLRDAHSRSLRELTADLLGLAERARAGRLTPAEMAGGTVTVTNLGQYRVDGFTPIVNPPQTAILGVGRIVEKPAVVDGRLEVRTLCTLTLSFDHRVVDGAPAAAFLTRLVELLERPYTLLGI